MPRAVRELRPRQAAGGVGAAGAVPERLAAQLVAAPESMDAWVAGWLAEAAPVLTYRAPRVAAQLLRQALRLLPEPDSRRGGPEAALGTGAVLLAGGAGTGRVPRPLPGRAARPGRAAAGARALAPTRRR